MTLAGYYFGGGGAAKQSQNVTNIFYAVFYMTDIFK